MDNNRHLLYKKLKQFNGSLTEIARRLGVQHQSVRKCLRDGDWDNPEFTRIAEEVLAERQSAFERTMQQEAVSN
ncbi:MAG: hypothetical protein JNL70_26560 [Saprospiraceae bacterium]|nr:hypothetical protein [Saprospiraceae bacterium]